MMSSIDGPGEIYIVQTPHCRNHHIRVFKTGRARGTGASSRLSEGNKADVLPSGLLHARSGKDDVEQLPI